MKCPACKTECHSESVCPECAFDDLAPVFINRDEGDAWLREKVEPYRYEYWKTLSDFEISGKTVVAYLGHGSIVNIPYGIEVIGENAFFECKDIRQVRLPDTVKSIEFSAFYGSRVESINLPDGLEEIDVHAFGETNLKHIIIPGSCKVIADEAFVCCFNLKSVIISQGVEKLERFAFHCCHEIELISLPASIVEIGEAALATMSHATKVVVALDNPRYYTCEGCLIDRHKSSIAAGFSDINGNINIPQSKDIVSIDSWAFSGQESKTLVDIPRNIRKIDAYAFANCGAINIAIHRKMETLGAYIADGCTGRIFCATAEKPITWDENWSSDSSPQIIPGKRIHWHGDTV